MDERVQRIIADAVALDAEEQAKREAKEAAKAAAEAAVKAAAPWASGSTDPKVGFAEFQLHLREITPRVRVLPTVFALNVLVFAAMVATGVSALSPTADNALTWGANYGPRTLNGEPWRLLANFFVHFGAIHLAANMFALWSAGAVVERLYGPLAFAAIYFAAGITGSIVSLAAHPTIVSAGASGAVFGVYGALAAFVLRRHGAIPKVVLSRLSGVAGSFIAYNFIYGAAHAGIDNAAHLGGLIGGFAAGAFLIRPLVIDRPSERRRPAMIAATAVILAGVVVLVMPRPLDLQTIIKDFAASESAILDRYNAITVSFDAHKVDMPQAADQIELTVLPPWRAARSKLDSQARAWRKKNHATFAQEHVIALLAQIGKIRDNGWTQVTAALRSGDGRAAATASHVAEGTVRRLQQTALENRQP
jgi:membrane associated rhomboid family serine protease